MSDWSNCRNILVIRPDNMGDLLMSTPAIRALKESFNARITVLTSSMAAGIARVVPEISEVMVYDLPWVKTKETVSPDVFTEIIVQISSKKFDAAVIFTVYSQNPLPTAMLAYLAGIPKRLAYCRENPYELLSNWVPDKEPYTEIKHQVRRDLDLVAAVGAISRDEYLSVSVPDDSNSLDTKLRQLGVDPVKPWLILHPGVSEKKREYPLERWIETGRILSEEYQLLITGANAEGFLITQLSEGIGGNAFSLAGKLTLPEFILLIKRAPLVISVNTGTIHIAAACKTPVIVLYALTNPQHSPWKVPGKVLPFGVQEDLKSRNEVIRFVNDSYFSQFPSMVMPDEIVLAAREILKGSGGIIPELLQGTEATSILS